MKRPLPALTNRQGPQDEQPTKVRLPMCRNACKYQFILHENEWCDECRKEEAERMEAATAEHWAGVEARVFENYTPATDSEWQRHLDTIAPRVGDQATEFRKLYLRPMKPGQPLPRLQPPTLDSL